MPLHDLVHPEDREFMTSLADRSGQRMPDTPSHRAVLGGSPKG
jgi:hypothetical protein